MPKNKRTEVKKTRNKGLSRVSQRGGFISFVDVAEKYKKSIVLIEVLQERRRTRPVPFFGVLDLEPELEKEVTNIGTGFVCDKRGYIITNQHVVQGTKEVLVSFNGEKKPVPARVVKSDYEMDLALLKTKLPVSTPVLQLGKSSKIRVGEWVMAVGNPLGLEHSVTVGVISAVNRPIKIGNRHYKQLIQTDAAINRGNSGGPLFNMNGEVVGINTAVSQSSQGIGFAIGIDDVRSVLGKWILPGGD